MYGLEGKEELLREIERLREELGKAKERELEFEKTRRAMLYLLEDNNEYAEGLLRSKRDWEVTFDSILDPILIHDAGMRILRCNKAYQAAAGLPFKEIIGRRYYDVFPKMAGPFGICKRITEGKENNHGEEEAALPERVYKLRFYPITGEDFTSVHVMEDITEMKEASRKMKEEMEISGSLLTIAFATSHTTDMDKLMEHVVESFSGVMESDICLSYLWDRERREFQPSMQKGLPAAAAPIFRTGSLSSDIPFIREAIEEKGPVVKGSGEGPPRAAFEWIDGWATLIFVPLVRKDELLGALVCLYSGDDLRYASGFTGRDREVIEGISLLVSAALDEARMYRESTDRALDLSRKVETIRIMNEIDKSILSTLKTGEILDTAARMVSRIVSCDRATVAIADGEKGGFIYEAGFGVSLEKGSVVPFQDTTASEVLRSGRPQSVPDLSESPRLPFEDGLYKAGFLSHLRVPLAVREEIIGVFSVGSRKKAAFTSEDLSVIEKIASQIGVALEKARLVSDLGELFLSTVRTLSEAIDAKSPWTKGHSDRVTKYAMDIGRQMGFSDDEMNDLELAGRLHDIGKLGTYEAILDKPGRLTEEEAMIMRRHAQKGADILAPIRQMRKIAPAIKHHHESFDGAGYPDGLKGNDIPLMARILAVADTVDAMSADRPYRKGKSMELIVAELERCSGTQFAPDVVEAFLQTLRQSGNPDNRRPPLGRNVPLF